MVTLGLLLAGGWWVTSRRVEAADRSAARRAATQRVALVRADASAVAVWLQTARGQLLGLAGGLSPWSGSGAQLAAAPRLLDGLVGSGVFDDGALIVDRSGTVLSADSRHLEEVGLARPAPAPGPGGVGFSPLSVDPLEHRLDMVMAAPLAGDSGALLEGRTRLPGGSLAAVLGGLRAPAGTRLAVLDPAGEDLTGPPPLQAGVPPALRYLGPRRLARAGRAGILDVRSGAGDRLAAAYAPAGQGWAVVVTQPAGSWASAPGAPWRAMAPALAATLAVALLAAVVLEADRVRLVRRLEGARATFLTAASHELRTPLTAIRGFSQLISGPDPLPTARLEEMAVSISRQSAVLEHLIERLLVGARLQGGGTPALRREPVDLVPVLTRVAEHHQGIAPLHQLVLRSPEELWVRGDAQALEQSVSQVVENAVKYSPGGGRVLITAWRRRRGAELSVRDEGVGLPQSLGWRGRRRIFDVLTQTERPGSRVYDEGGLGIGLFIASSLLARMGGSIRAMPPRAVGAEFRIRLVAAQPPSAPLPESRPQ